MRRIIAFRQPTRLLAEGVCCSRPTTALALTSFLHQQNQQTQRNKTQTRTFSATACRSRSRGKAKPPKPKKVRYMGENRNGQVEEYSPENDPDADLVDGDIEYTIKAPGRLRSAARQNEVDDPFYSPATSGEGLEEVGGVSGWWEDDRHWSSSLEYVGFGPRQQITDPAVLEALARRAVVETLAVNEVLGAEALGGGAVWQEGGADEMRMALETQLHPRDTGSVGLDGHVTTIVDRLMKPRLDVEPTGSAQADVLLHSQQAAEYRRSWDKSWKTISLQDLRLKFAVNKRIQQLTGHVIPDHKLLNVRTVAGYLDVLIKPPPPKKLAEVIERKGELGALPNVTVYTRRVTPIDRQKMVGRWKVIVDELEKRQIPVIIDKSIPGNVELKWARGES